MASDIFRPDVRRRAPFNIMRAPRVEDQRGTEPQEIALVEAVTRFAATGARELLRQETKTQAYTQEAQGAYNLYRERVAEPRAQFKVTEFEGAQAQFPVYQKQVQSIADEISKNLSPEAKKLFDLSVGSYNVTLANESQEHLAKEFIKTGKKNAKVNVQLSVQEAMLNPYNKEGDVAVGMAIYNEEALAASSTGAEPSEDIQSTIDVNSARKYSAYLRQKLEYLSGRPGDGIFAQKFFQDNENLMTPEDRTAVEVKVRNASLKDQAEVYAKEAFSAHPGNPARGFSEIGKIPNPEFQRAALTEFNRLITIDKQNTAARRNDAWQGFHELLDKLEPGSDDMQVQVEELRSYMGSISDKLNNLGGSSTLKEQMQQKIDQKLKPTKKESDPQYKAELTRMMEDVETFSATQIDHNRLSPADSKSFSKIQVDMLKGDAKTLKNMKAANTDYYATIENVLKKKGILAEVPTGSGSATLKARDQTIAMNQQIVDMVASEFFDDLISLRDAYNIGAQFKDSNTISNINANRKLLEERMSDYVDRFIQANPQFMQQESGFLWFKSMKDTKPADRLQMLEDRKFVAPPIPSRPSGPPPATRQGREETARRAKQLLESVKKLQMSTPKEQGQ